MRHAAPLRTVLAAFLMAITPAGTALAGPLNDAVAAYSRGDYAKVLRLLTPLANAGNVLAQYNLGTAEAL
jgi:hypothetical protein